MREAFGSNSIFIRVRFGQIGQAPLTHVALKWDRTCWEFLDGDMGAATIVEDEIEFGVDTSGRLLAARFPLRSPDWVSAKRY